MAFLELQDIKKYFPVKRGILQMPIAKVRAADFVSLEVEQSKNLGIAGESGCGKSTLARIMTKLIEPDSGRIKFKDIDITDFSPSKMRPQRKFIQIVFQDPFNSLDPRFTVRDIIKEAYLVFRREDLIAANREIEELIQVVGLHPNILGRYPHEFSGGERQRIAIARALAAKPELLILDEAASSLDILMQSQIMNLLNDLQERFNLTYIFISHNLRVIKKMTLKTAIMYLGKIVEFSDTRDIFIRPTHPYTNALLAASLELRVALKGEISQGIDIPSGCRFHPRCPYRQDICSQKEPPLEEKVQGCFAACHFPLLHG